MAESIEVYRRLLYISYGATLFCITVSVASWIFAIINRRWYRQTVDILQLYHEQAIRLYGEERRELRATIEELRAELALVEERHDRLAEELDRERHDQGKPLDDHGG